MLFKKFRLALLAAVSIILLSLTTQSDSHQIVVSSFSALENLEKECVVADFSSNNLELFTTISSEITLLKKSYPGKKRISFKNDKVKNQAPSLYKELYERTQKLCEKGNVTMPKLYLYVANKNSSYNASAQQITIQTTSTKSFEDGSKSTDIQINKYFKLTVGEQTLKLFFWRTEYMDHLSAVIAHEIGHIFHQHVGECSTHEHEADQFALTLLAKPNILSQALDMVTLAGEMFDKLSCVKNRLSDREYNDIIRKVTCTVARTVSNMGSLGNAQSHAFYASLIKRAMQKVTKKVKKNVYEDNQDKILTCAYEQLRNACIDPTALLGYDSTSFAQQCLHKENEKAAYCPSSHPAPGVRRSFINKCLQSA